LIKDSLKDMAKIHDINIFKKEIEPKVFLRWVIASIFAFIGFVNGFMYTTHMCNAGYPLIETFFIGIIVLLLILFIPKYRYSMPISIALLIVQFYIKNPYLDWIHR